MVPVHPRGELGSRGAGSSQAGTFRDTGSLGGTEPVSAGLGDGLLGMTLVLVSVNTCQTKGAGFCPTEGVA